MKSVRAVFLFVASAVLLLPTLAGAQDLGQPGPSYVGAGSFPSGDKPQSKLWFHDGTWWGSLFSTTARVYRIHRLDRSTWVDTGTPIDPRNTAHADCLSVGDRLYIGSHHYQGEGFDGFPMFVTRYSYSAATRTYAVDPGFPVQVSNSSSEALTIARDSTNRVWAAWTSGRRVWIAHTLADDLSWSTPFVLPTNTTDIGAGDIGAIVRFGNRVGVLWSDDVAGDFLFSWHQDGAPAAAWSTPEIVADRADDHVCLKATADGRVFAILKNTLDETSVHVRGAAGGWSRHIASTPADGWTRSILVLDEEHRRLMVFGTQPLFNGTIYAKNTSLDAPAFFPGRGFAFLRVASDLSLNDATSTKQSVSSATGLVVMASHQPVREYWWRGVPLSSGGAVQPVADFEVPSRSGSVPFQVQFTDTSSGNPTAWFWTFGDGTSSTERNPTHVYTAVGNYTVRLGVSNTAGSDVLTRPAFIEVTGPRVRPLEDTFVRRQGSQIDLGGKAHLRAGEHQGESRYETFLRFDLSGIDPADIGSTFLRLHTEDSGVVDLEVFVVTGGWDEHELTWDDRPARLQSVLGPDTFQNAGFVDLDFGPALGTGIVNLGIVARDGTSVQFSSKEGAFPPELVTMPPE